MEDVEKLDNIQDCFIHYQLHTASGCSIHCGVEVTELSTNKQHTLSLRFCQATRLQYLNGQVQLANQQVLQQQHVDHKISNALLKKGTR